MALLPPPDIGAAYVDTRTGDPTKDFYNWVKALYDYTRNISGGGGGGGTPGGAVGNIQYNAGAGNFGGLTNSQVTALLDIFTSSARGVVPPPGPSTGRFLRDDVSWVTPPTGGGGGSARTQRAITSGPVTVLGTDSILNISISSLPVNIFLPAASSRAGEPLTFKDALGNAGSGGISISPSGADFIDGKAVFVLNANHAAVTLYPFNDGFNSGWFIT